MLSQSRPHVLAPGVLALLLVVAICERLSRQASRSEKRDGTSRGMLLDHDCVIVTGGLAGTAIAGSITPILPVLIPLAFANYVVDSYEWSRCRQLRASFSGAGTTFSTS